MSEQVTVLPSVTKTRWFTTKKLVVAVALLGAVAAGYVKLNPKVADALPYPN